MKKLSYLYIPVALSLIGTVMIYSRLPEEVPMHWNIHGEIDSWRPRYFVFFTALLPGLFTLLLQIIPKIDPKAPNFLRHRKAYTIVSVITIIFLIGVHWTTLLHSLGFPLKIDVIIRLMLGVLFILIGNYLPQAKPNYSFGIRIPWTLADDTVWRKTHRIGGFLFVITGIIAILTVLFTLLLPEELRYGIGLRISFWVIAGTTIGTIAAVTVYAYREFVRKAR